jgi:hypothetical protein
MKKNIVLSERQKPRALETMKNIYAAHSATCSDGASCHFMVNLKREIKSLEGQLGAATLEVKHTVVK